ncbi:hypothetical protein ACJW30_10G124600 [Castanea mollissima]
MKSRTKFKNPDFSIIKKKKQTQICKPEFLEQTHRTNKPICTKQPICKLKSKLKSSNPSHHQTHQSAATVESHPPPWGFQKLTPIKRGDWRWVEKVGDRRQSMSLHVRGSTPISTIATLIGVVATPFNADRLLS